MNNPKPIQNGIITFMKITFFQIIMAVVCTALVHAHNTNGQELLEKRVSIKANNQNIKSILRKIEREAGVTFSYKAQLLNSFETASLDVKNEPLGVVLNKLFNLRLSFEVFDTQIILHSLPLDSNAVVVDSTFTISGKVTDEFDMPLPGVNILIKGTTIGTTSDVKGHYSLSVPDRSAILVFSFIGYKSSEIAVGNKNEISLSLSPDVQSLNEIIVVGYGTSKKIDLTGAVSRVNMDDKALQPNVNLVQAMRGTIAGVAVTDNGRAGSDGSIVIRGFSSISGSNAPLIVLDGIPYYGGLSDINSNDIESIDVLKDGSSAAIYGSRASNGVIMITTKKGKSDKPKLNYNGYFGFSDFAHLPSSMNAEKYLQLKQDASAFTGKDLTQLNPLEQESFDAGRTIDPWDEIKQDAPMQSHELSISGKTNKVNYYLSGSYVDQKSPLYGDQFKRLSSRLNLDIEITDWLKIGTNTAYTIKDYSGQEADFSVMNFISPFAQFYNAEGQINRLPMNDGLVTNPLYNTIRIDNSDLRYNLFSNLYAEIKLPIKGLTYRIRNGNTLLQNEYFYYSPSFNREGFNTLGFGSKSHGKTSNLVLENIIRYDLAIGDGHNIDVTMLYGFEKSTSNSSRLTSNNIFNDALGYNGLNIGENPTVTTTARESQAVSSMARVSYRFHEKYMLNATVRRDGFSAFGTGKKFGVFPSLGASWVMSGENFLSRVNWLELLKLRFSYGKNGNRGVEPYTSLSNIAITQYVFGDQGAPTIGLYPSSFPNPLLGWETTVSSNLGVDFGFFKGRINGAVDFYTRNTSDLLLELSVPAVNGYDKFFTNIGKMNNKGVEITLNTVNVDKNNIKWSSNFVYTSNRNEVIELNGKQDDIASRRFIGEPLFSHYDYVFDGIWQDDDDFALDPNAKPGFIRFKDLDSDGAITPKDRKVIGTSQANFVWAVTNELSWKGLSLSFVVNGRVGGISANPVRNPGTNFYDRANVLDVPYWTPENRDASHPAVGYANPYGYGFYQSRDYVRLQDITLAYTLPNAILSRIKLGQARVYISGKNLKTWTDWIGFDPEHGEMTAFSQNLSALSGPLIRSYVVGLSIGL